MKLKINVDTEIKTLDGRPVLTQDAEGNKPLRVAVVLANALLEPPGQGEPRLSGEDQLQRWQLAQRIYAGGEVEVSAEEVVLLKKQVARCYGPLIAGQALELLG